MKKLHVEIWSDVVCPFCYIGKRQFEQALALFSGRESVTVEWKSYQLDATVKTDASANALERLASKYGWTMLQTQQAIQRVVQMASKEGLVFDMEKTKVINSFDAHRLTHLAKKYGKQHEMEEKLFAAHFCEGQNAADAKTLIQLGASVGLPESEIEAMLSSEAFAKEVDADVAQAKKLGIRGVPFFLLNHEFSVSGAQGTESFMQALVELSCE